ALARGSGVDGVVGRRPGEVREDVGSGGGITRGEEGYSRPRVFACCTRSGRRSLARAWGAVEPVGRPVPQATDKVTLPADNPLDYSGTAPKSRTASKGPKIAVSTFLVPSPPPRFIPLISTDSSEGLIGQSACGETAPLTSISQARMTTSAPGRI